MFPAEIEAHLQHEIDRLQERGLGDEEAREAAQRAFGNVLLVQESLYEQGRWLWWDRLFQDVRFGLRMLRAEQRCYRLCPAGFRSCIEPGPDRSRAAFFAPTGQAAAGSEFDNTTMLPMAVGNAVRNIGLRQRGHTRDAVFDVMYDADNTCGEKLMTRFGAQLDRDVLADGAFSRPILPGQKVIDNRPWWTFHRRLR